MIECNPSMLQMDGFLKITWEMFDTEYDAKALCSRLMVKVFHFYSVSKKS